MPPDYGFSPTLETEASFAISFLATSAEGREILDMLPLLSYHVQGLTDEGFVRLILLLRVLNASSEGLRFVQHRSGVVVAAWREGRDNC